jgi:outer membrane protein assembly factor BamB
VKLSTCDDDFKNALAEATCLPEGPAPATAEADTHYLLKTKENAVALGTSAAGPIVSGIGPGFKVTWTTPLVDDGTKPLPGAPHIADLANGRLYVIYGKVYFDSRLAALDAENGKRLWDVPLVGSIGGVGSIGESGRGQAVALVASKSRVYVSRSGGGLDVFSATDGKSLGTVGKK